MNAAATQDVRAITFVPMLAAVLRGGPAPSPRATRMLELLEAWRAKGGSRLDRDLDGKIDDPGAAVLDTAWPGLADAAITPVLGQALADQLNNTLHRRFDLPPGGQFGGWHMYMDKDLRTLLGKPVKGKLRQPLLRQGRPRRLPRRAVGGDRGRRRPSSRPPRAPTRTPGARTPRASGSRSRPGCCTYTMRYTNRPSGIQQVIEFGGTASRG